MLVYYCVLQYLLDDGNYLMIGVIISSLAQGTSIKIIEWTMDRRYQHRHDYYYYEFINTIE